MFFSGNLRQQRIFNNIFVGAVLLLLVFTPLYLLPACFRNNPRFNITKDNVEVRYHLAGENRIAAGVYSTATTEDRDGVWQHITANVTNDPLEASVLKQVNLFRIDYEKLRSAIAQSATYRAAEIERTLPNKLTVVITPRVPVALLQSPNYVCDRDGVIMHRNPQEVPITNPLQTPTIPQIVGLRTGDARRAAFLEGNSISGEILPALQLIEHIAHNRDMGVRLHKISLLKPEVMTVACIYRADGARIGNRWLLELPTEPASLKKALERLAVTLRDPQFAQFNYLRLIFEYPVAGRISQTDMNAHWRLEGV